MKLTEEILKELIEIVDSNMSDNKSDFYKYDLSNLYSSEPNGFALMVRETGTSLVYLDKIKREQELRASSVERFRFAKNPLFRFDWFSYIQYNFKIGVIVIDGELKTYSELGEFLEVAKEAYQRTIKGLDEMMRSKFPEEVKFYGTKIPIHFTDKESRAKAFEMIKNDDNNLLHVLERFRHYERLDSNEVIMLWVERWGNECGIRFSQVRDERCILTGGIWQDKESKTWSSHT